MGLFRFRIRLCDVGARWLGWTACVTRVGRVLGTVLIVVGLFWAGRETGHGITALWEHWSCPLPLVAILLGATALLAERLARST